LGFVEIDWVEHSGGCVKKSSRQIIDDDDDDYDCLALIIGLYVLGVMGWDTAFYNRVMGWEINNGEKMMCI
jgi:hypothetical protein